LKTSSDRGPVKTLDLQNDFGTASDWHVTAWQSASQDFATGDMPARLCFWISRAEQEKNCTAITSALPDDTLVYPYQSVRELEVARPDRARPSAALLKFDARYSGGGSGWLDQISFWKYDRRTDGFEPALRVTLTEQGEYRLFDQGKLAGTLVTAEAVWQGDETHFAPHRFYIEVYRYDAKAGYVKMLGYLTALKYPGLDDVEKIDVIRHEIPGIVELMSFIGRSGQRANALKKRKPALPLGRKCCAPGTRVRR
jgi:hypothetical protein